MNNPNYEVSLTLRVPTFGDIKIERIHPGYFKLLETNPAIVKEFEESGFVPKYMFVIQLIHRPYFTGYFVSGLPMTEEEAISKYEVAGEYRVVQKIEETKCYCLPKIPKEEV